MNPESKVKQAYRQAFQAYSSAVRRVQHVIAHAPEQAAAIDAAVLELETARVVYNSRRDAVVQELVPAAMAHVGLHAESRDEREAHVSRVAELLWEAAGRPEGTAKDDWHRAEEIIRRAGS